MDAGEPPRPEIRISVLTRRKRRIFFVFEEGRPPYIVNRFGKESRRQTFDVQVFDGNPAEVQDKPVRQLVLKVSPLVRNVLVRHLQQQNGFSGHRRTLLPVVVVRQSRFYGTTDNREGR